jgi:hypothetical protein
MQVPRLEKKVLNIGLGEAIANAKALESGEADLAAISGQHPLITRSKRSIRLLDKDRHGDRGQSHPGGKTHVGLFKNWSPLLCPG